MDYKNIQRELQEEILRLYKSRDDGDVEKQMEALSDKMEIMKEFCSLQEEYQKTQDINEMTARGTVTQKNDAEIEELKNKWEMVFAGGLTDEERKEIHLDDFLWHACSYKKIDLLENDEAREAFNKAIKKEVIGFYQNENDVLNFRDGSILKDSDFDLEEDIYVMDADYKWTYIVTHEKEQCGPYFIEAKEI